MMSGVWREEIARSVAKFGRRKALCSGLGRVSASSVDAGGVDCVRIAAKQGREAEAKRTDV